ncbi:MAG: molybdopterin-dependent oxidoreductase [Syntrophaceae bacterium]|nr:molybdopterin-dependent oxidoreductase [Syntrophaceae bacterium]
MSKVTGRAEYTDDLVVPGMVYGRILRSPYAHARVKRIDPSAAERVPGVLAVLGPADVPQKKFNCAGNPPSALLVKDETVLTDHPLYAGDRVAAIAALTPEACAEGLKKISVEYEPLPPVFTVEEALDPRAIPLHADLFPTNGFWTLEREEGRVEQGLAESDRVFEREYSTPFVQHVPLEPAGCVCHYTREGFLTVWATTQTPFQDRRILAELLDLPESRVRVIKPVMGGGFGSRQQLVNQHVAAFLSKRVNRPVKIINTREEELLTVAVRHGTVCRLRCGIKRDGRLHAFDAQVFLNTGAYCTHGPIVSAAQSRKFQYRIPHYRYRGTLVYTNGPAAGAMRGYGNPQLTFARERMMDDIAKSLEMDPVRFRLMNHLEIGDRIPTSPIVLQSCAIPECVEGGEAFRRDIEKREEERTPPPGVLEAWGVAFSCHTSGPSNAEGMSSSFILLNDDGSVNLMTGSADIGQGSETTLSQIVAEELGIRWEDVRVTAADTQHTPYDSGTYASSQIYVSGNAVLRAARDLKENFRQALIRHFKTEPQMIRFEKGRVRIPTEEGEVDLSFPEAAAKVTFGGKGAVIMGRCSYKAEDSPLPFAVCWAKVAVDTITRTVRVRHLIQAVDVGTPINPEVVRGQVEGGICMGLGFALTEQIEFDPRAKKPVSTDLLHYKIPTAMDMPEIQVYIAQKSYEPTGPFGAKSVGELPTVPVAAAIANAVAKAVGEDVTVLPLSNSFVTGGTGKSVEKF